MLKPYSAVIRSPVAMLGIHTQGEVLVGIDFLSESTAECKPVDAFTAHVVSQIKAYFGDSRLLFDVPLVLHGTDFQQRVWQALTKIPPTMVKTYGELARELGTGARAVGNACRRNPIPIVVPCHRVVSASGIGGYAGHTAGCVLDRKYWLLRHENIIC